MRYRITKGGIFGADGKEIAVGQEFTSETEPTGFAGRYEIIGDASDDAEFVVNPVHPVSENPAESGEGRVSTIPGAPGQNTVPQGQTPPTTAVVPVAGNPPGSEPKPEDAEQAIATIAAEREAAEADRASVARAEAKAAEKAAAAAAAAKAASK